MSMLAIPGMLLFGTSTVVVSKILFSMRGVSGPDGSSRLFTKPWAQTDAMFAGMVLCLVAYFVEKRFSKSSKQDPEQQKLLQRSENSYGSTARKPKDEPPPTSTFKTCLLVATPAICDLIATLLGNVGLQYISGSVYQMLRGAMVIFSAILSIIFLNRKFYLFNWIGISLVILALVLVGVSCLNSPPPPGQAETSSNEMLFGIIVVVLAQLVQASQVVIEEFLLKNVKASAFLIVGMEGFWGLIITTLICLPIFQTVSAPGFSEDSIETWYMITHNSNIRYAMLFYVAVILLYNATAMMVTQQFTAVHRTILEAMRTLCIWVVNLFIYYEITPSFGEHWSGWSWFELAGFGVLLIGMFIYNEVIELTCLPDYKTVVLAEEGAAAAKKAPPELAKRTPKLPPMSPYIRSPRK